MVQSIIDKTINYIESKKTYPEDMDYQCSMYELDPLFIPIAVAIGQVRTDKKGVAYFPIYLLKDKNGEPAIHSQIGVFEVDEKDAISVIGEENEVLIENMGEPLLFSFATADYLKRAKSEPRKYFESTKEPTESKESKESPKKPKIDDLFHISKTKKTREKQVIQDKLKNGIFDEKTKKVFDKKAKKSSESSESSGLKPLEEETESIAQQWKDEYQETKTDLWIQRFMKNAHYSVSEVEGDGDCLFSVIITAFKEIGKETTVSKLRALVANDVSESLFSDRIEMFKMLASTKSEIKEQMATLKATINDPVNKARIKDEKNKAKQREMVAETKAQVKEYNQLVTEANFNTKLYHEFKYMSDIHTIEDYRAYIMTSRYWADAWAISVLERALKMKMIILSEEAFEEGALFNVLQCGEPLPDDVKSFVPEHYIMASYTGNHYNNITYNDHKIMRFSEIPYDVKILITKKCMERSAGIYHAIQDFRDFKSQLGIDNEEEEVIIGGNGGLYDADFAFTFHEKSANDIPGKGVGEKMVSHRLSEFAQLAENFGNWRRKLDDSWECAGLFTLDNHTWRSVEHYLLGAQFKKGFPDVYLKFSADSKSDVSQSLAKARIAHTPDENSIIIDDVETKGVHHDKFFDHDKEREEALVAKFVQNEDMKQILLYTRDALLQHFVQDEPPKPDYTLMQLRKRLL